MNRFRRFSENLQLGFSGNHSISLQRLSSLLRSFTILTAQFRKIAHRYQRRYETIDDSLPLRPDFADSGKERDRLIFGAQFFNFMGEVEAVFGIWLVPLFVAIIAFHGWSTMVDYVGHVNIADATFVVAIMAIATSLPILRLAENLIAKISAIGNRTPASWWLAILTLGRYSAPS